MISITEGGLDRIMTLLRDVHEARLEAQRLARTDPLTGTLNRRHFAELAEREFERARRSGGPVALLLLDFDDFKRINDDHGHAAGDAVLKAAAAAVAARLRMVDVLARWGGEEFVVLLPGTPQAEAVRVAERLREAVMAVATPIADGRTARTSTSIGVAVAERGSGSLQALVAAADQAMYAAKHAGRNRVAAATGPSAPAAAA
jgi:diguanylate cyclase (GGDEF)-like protein